MEEGNLLIFKDKDSPINCYMIEKVSSRALD